MQRKLSEKPDDTPEEPPPDRANDLWSDDQSRRGYYYDDTHGYQPYLPDAGDVPEDDENKHEDGPTS